MVLGAFPAAKLGALLLRQISRPIARRVKEQAKNSPVFRKYVCMPPAQFYNWCEVKIKMWVLNLGKPVNIPVLNEAMAIELGANLLGEAVIFTIAAAVLLSEYNRSSRKEAAKEEAKRKEMCDIHEAIRELYIQFEEHGAQIREISRKIGYMDTNIQDISRKSELAAAPPDAIPEPNPEPEDLPMNDSVVENLAYYPMAPRPSNLIFKALDELGKQLWSGKG